MATRASRIGAGCYALWGAIHVVGGLVLLQAALTGTEAFLRAQQGGPPRDPIGPTVAAAPEIASGVFAFHAFNLVWLGLLTLLVAVRLNWRNSTAGYWVNLGLVGFTDLGLLLFIVGPGIMTWADAWIGPALFVPALVFSTLGLRSTVEERRR